MRRTRHGLAGRLALGFIFLLLLAPAALAGMPRPVVWVLTPSAETRVKAISFFVAVILVSALAVKWIWNRLRRDFPRLPRATYGKALGMVVLWGALFVLVLTMISGARELLTPGAWRPNGATYELRGSGE